MEEIFDINLYDSDDINFNVIISPLHLFFQEIELAVKIAPGEIWGAQYAIDLNKYLFNQYVTLNQIKSEISTFIGKNCSQSQNFQYDINVQILNVENKDLIYIQVTIYNEEENEDFIQKFLLGN